jgi:hypothetical protein
MEELNKMENFNELDLFTNLENIKDIFIKDKLSLELKNSIIPEWKIISDTKLINNNDKIFININYQSNFESDIETDFVNHISNGITNTNQINEFDSEIVFDIEKIKLLKKLHDFGIQFDMRFNLEYKIKIKSNEIVFPMCCVGKNRSQYLFYYLKKIQGLSEINFEVGYPSSGDELSVMIDYLLNDENNNKNRLSSFFPQYKKDNFSNVIYKSLNITNPHGLTEVSRSIHVFDKILKIKHEYLVNELKNFEIHQYKENKYNIFDCNQDYLKIKMIFEKYFLLPDNLLKILNYDLDKTKKINKITFICASDKSFYNLCLCFNSLTIKFPEVKLDKIRIVYFGIKDIFQKSNIKLEDLDNFKQKIIDGFCFDN